MTHADFLSLYNTLKMLWLYRDVTPCRTYATKVEQAKPYDVISIILALAR